MLHVDNHRGARPFKPSEYVDWDGAAGAFVRVTLGPARQLLRRVELAPPERWAVVRRLMILRTSQAERRAMVALLHRLELIIEPPRPGKPRPTVAELNRRFVIDSGRPDVAAILRRFEIGIADLLFLAWCVNAAGARPGWTLPALEEIDHNAAYFPPVGVVPPPAFDADAALAELGDGPDDLGFAGPAI